MKKLILLACVVCVFVASVGVAQETVGWRTDGTGHYPDANPPTVWRAAKGDDEGKNIVWASKMPDWSNSTPAIAGDSIFVGSDKTELVCVKRSTGEILWKTDNGYLDGLTGQELEDAKAMVKAAKDLREKIKPEQDKLRNVRNRLNNIKNYGMKISRLEGNTAELKTDEGRAAKIAAIIKDVQAAIKALQEKPDDKNQKKRLEQLTDQLKDIASKEWRTKKLEELAKQLADSQKKLAEAKPEEEEQLNKEAEQLKQVVDNLGNELKGKTKYDLPNAHPATGYSTCTPVTDGKNVWGLLSNGMAACYDLDGNRKWIKFIEKSTDGNGHSASPLLVGDNFIIQMNNTLRALNKDTGEEVWTAQASVQYGTPVVTAIGDVDVIITPRGDIVRADDGTILKKNVSKLDFCAPIVHDGVAYFIERGGKAIKLPEKITEDMVFEELWQLKNVPGGRYYASPVYHDGLIYAMNEGGHLIVVDVKGGAPVLDAKTGEPVIDGEGKPVVSEPGSVVYDKKLNVGGTVYPSVTCAGKYIYASGENGKTIVFETGREHKEVAVNQLEKFRSCPVFSGSRMYLRGNKNLYCIGE
ncbi:MAG: PQQ-binding-like beta-propeller repeat protein [Planctomycetes bacterium]|nr:PQQ-binding-like beta-propeller repeat protein [Planctomycetota bacterium]